MRSGYRNGGFAPVAEFRQHFPSFQHREPEEPDGQGGAGQGSQPVKPPSGPDPANHGWAKASGGVGAGPGEGAFCKNHNTVERRHQKGGKTPQLSMSGKIEDTCDQHKAGDDLADKRGGNMAGEGNGVAVADACALFTPQQQRESAEDGSCQLGQYIAEAVSGEHSFAQPEGETDDGVDMGPADPADG